MHFQFYQLHEVFVYIYAEALEMFGLVSGQRVQRRFSLSETTLQQVNFRGMVHNNIFIIVYGINNFTNYGRRHSKLFINCHVSWDTMLCEVSKLQDFISEKPSQSWLNYKSTKRQKLAEFVQKIWNLSTNPEFIHVTGIHTLIQKLPVFGLFIQGEQ